MDHAPTMPIPDGSVVITPAQMYTEIRETRSAVDRLTNTIDPALSEVRRDLVDLVQRVAASEVTSVKNTNRITVLETKLTAAWAVLALLIAAIGAVAGFLGH